MKYTKIQVSQVVNDKQEVVEPTILVKALANIDRQINELNEQRLKIVDEIALIKAVAPELVPDVLQVDAIAHEIS